MQWLGTQTENDGIARPYFPIAFYSANSYKAVCSHTGGDPVGSVFLDAYRTATHIPVTIYDIVSNSHGVGWGIFITAIGY